MMRLRLQMLTPVSAKCSWNRRMSSTVAVSGDRLRNAANRLQLRMWPALRARTELARVHVLDHALAQRADSIGTHRQLLSGMRLTTPRSSRQDAPPAIDDLHPGYRTRGRAARLSGLSRSDLVLWPFSTCRDAAELWSLLSKRTLRWLPAPTEMA